jgi:hypothetical protein
VCTSVSVTLNGVVTLTRGAAVSVEPVTATLPVAPVSVHSGATPSAGADVGQPLSAVAGAVEGGGVTVSLSAGPLGDVEDVLVEVVVLSELHAASIATPSASATQEYQRKKFTADTLHPRHAIPATSPRTGSCLHVSVYLEFTKAPGRQWRCLTVKPASKGGRHARSTSGRRA